MRTAAVIGCGDVSAVHFEAIAANPDIELVAVCDADPSRLAAAAAFHGVKGYADHQTLLDEVRVDVVHICTPHSQHASMAVDALERGVNVLMEKPLAHTLIGGERLVQAASRSSARIGVCFQNRYNEPVQAMHALLSSGELGAVTGGAATVMWSRSAAYYQDRPWRGTWSGSGGGLMMNQAIHTLDLLQWLVGEVAEVSGHAASHLLGDVIEVEDTAELALTHVNGARSVFYATLANTVNAPVTLDIVAEKAVLSLRNGLTVTYPDGRVDVVPERASHSTGRAYWGFSHELLIQDFYSALNRPGPFWISPAEALKSLRIVKSLYAQSYPDTVPHA
ncbi:Gfo/Idh/MocA family oxidoreductase [Paeniglutamicibacter antarcticus]|uniref:Gfo/Idh/MocA family oxidoreductase n=1 Tax=Arthrobacter terrae TaxID=2935737 RepID=A0A931G6Z4_9MICC|nr:Gfo/Idh/MocA family oxidoreductase [Arthrobacter terrae]MBG0741583.1 Gfo/Idh/MocA family oxidoreductase [Arthrobacter terrae]